ncbi:MAG: hypothetical protein HC824_21190 [Synechococcales cyanobacterium RM1_1_8]|nr:hypothetical protein [Synechococcales cyanobacterium RM1_1_8]
MRGLFGVFGLHPACLPVTQEARPTQFGPADDQSIGVWRCIVGGQRDVGAAQHHRDFPTAKH